MSEKFRVLLNDGRELTAKGSFESLSKQRLNKEYPFFKFDDLMIRKNSVTVIEKIEEERNEFVDFLVSLDNRIKQLEEKQEKLNIEKIINESVTKFVDKLKPYGFNITDKKDRGIITSDNREETLHIGGNGDINVIGGKVNDVQMTLKNSAETSAKVDLDKNKWNKNDDELTIQIKPVVVGLDELYERIYDLQDQLDILNATGKGNDSLAITIKGELGDTREVEKIAKDIQEKLKDLKFEFRL